MRGALTLLALVLALLASWRFLTRPVNNPPRRTPVSHSTAPEGPSVSSVPAVRGVDPPKECPVEPPPTAPEEESHPGLVRGTVWGDDGKPAQAEVQFGIAQGSEALASTRSGSDGTFRASVAAGTLTVIAFTPEMVSWPEEVTVASGEEYEVDLFLFAGATVYGCVSGPDASPLADVSIVCSDDGDQVRSRARSDANGQYRMTVPAEHVCIRAEREGLAPALGFVEPAERQQVRKDLRMGAPGSIRGEVVDEAGRPVPEAGIELSLVREDGQVTVLPSWQTATDTAGRFDLGGLPNESFTLDVTASNLLPSQLEGVRPGGQDLRLVLAAGARVTGQVVRRADGRPIEKPRVSLVRMKGAAAAHAEVGEQGCFTITAVTPGSYVVAAWAEGFAPGESATFVVGAGGTAEGIRVELSLGGTLRGVVLDEASRTPIQGADVSLRGPFEGGRPSGHLLRLARNDVATTNADGKFEMSRLPVGEIQVSVTHGAYLGLWQAVEIGEGRTTDATFLMETGGRIEGMLLDRPGGQPLRNGRLWFAAERHSWECSAGGTGRVSADRLPPGKYLLHVLEEEEGRTRIGVQEVEVRSGERLRVEIVPDGKGRLWGKVSPPSQEALVLRPARDDMLGTLDIRVQTDAAGQYEVLGAPPGEYEAEIGGMRERITLPEGDYEVRKDFELPLEQSK